MKKFLTIALISVALSSCDKSHQSGNGYDTENKMVVETSDVVLSPPSVNQMRFPPPVVKADMEVLNNESRPGITNKINVDKKIIKEGELRFKTADIAATRKALYASLKKLGGYVAEESETNESESGQKEVTLNTRIPAKDFDLFLSNIVDNAESIDSKSIRIKDVTTQFIDVTTQLGNKKKLEERYLELLKKGSKIADLLEIESKLTEIRSDIESTQGQLNYLEKQIAYSSLDITFYAKQSTKDNGQTFSYKIKNAFTSGWQTLGGLFFGFIAWWPVWLILTGLIYLFKRWRK